MLNERIDSIRIAGTAAVQVRFDLPDHDLRAIADSLATTIRDRYRCARMTAEDVLDLRELVAVQEQAGERAEDGYDGGTLVVSVRRLGLLVGALRDGGEHLVDELGELYMRALEAALATSAPVG